MIIEKGNNAYHLPHYHVYRGCCQYIAKGTLS